MNIVENMIGVDRVIKILHCSSTAKQTVLSS